MLAQKTLSTTGDLFVISYRVTDFLYPPPPISVHGLILIETLVWSKEGTLTQLFSLL